MSEEIEQEARKQGWKPESEWKGDPPTDGFKSAEQFVKDGENIPGILKSKISHLENRVDSLTQSNANFKQYTDKQRDKDQAENKRLIGELESVKAQAITDGDGVAAVKAEREINELQVNDPPPNQPQPNPEGESWVASNGWYNENPVLHAQADGVADQLRMQGYDDQSALFFTELTTRVKQAFPNEFENPNRNNAASVEDGGSRDAGDAAEHTWANLPADAKAAATSLITDIPGFTKEEYLENYEWSKSNV